MPVIMIKISFEILAVYLKVTALKYSTLQKGESYHEQHTGARIRSSTANS